MRTTLPASLAAVYAKFAHIEPLVAAGLVRHTGDELAVVNALATRWLPPARIQHPWPWDRFDARTRGKSPVR